MELDAIFLEQPHPCTLSDHKTYLHAIATNHDEWVTNRDHNSWWLDRPPVNGCQESILDRPNQFLTPSSNRSNNNLNPYHQNQYINRDATKNWKFYDFVPNCTPFRNPLFGEESAFSSKETLLVCTTRWYRQSLPIKDMASPECIQRKADNDWYESWAFILQS